MKPIWWVHPFWAALCMGAVGPILAYLFSDSAFIELWGTPKYFTGYYLVLSSALLLMLLSGIAIGSAAKRTSEHEPDIDYSRIARANRWLFSLTILGYAAWLAAGLLRGLTLDHVVLVLQGSPGAIRSVKETLAPVAGVTTLTQLGPVAAVGIYIESRIHGTPRRRIVFLIGLATVRSVLYAERLALLEVLIPLVIIAVGFPGRRYSVPTRRRLALAPLIAPLVLASLFGVFEYLRSWSNYYAEVSDQSYVEFTTSRLAGYYATSSNNSALLNEMYSDGLPFPYYSVRGLWTAPGVEQAGGYAAVSGFEPEEQWDAGLERFANPEFNNEGGTLPIIVDYGFLGAGVYWLVVGFAIGLVHKSFALARPLGLLLYPPAFIGLLELSRFDYWSLGRFVPVVIAASVTAYLLRERRPNLSGGPRARRTTTSL